ncbi:MAG: alanine racemase [Alphaproteobacteria bacterium]
MTSYAHREPSLSRNNVFRAQTKGALLKVDLSAIQANYRALRTIVAGGQVAAVVKADAYGLGARRVAPALYGAGARQFFVATLDEGIVVRSVLPDLDVEIYVLNGVFSGSESYFPECHLTPVLNDLDDVQNWGEFCQKRGEKHSALVHLDTGLNRLGMVDAEVQALIQDPSLLSSFSVRYWMSHLACPDDYTHPMNAAQLARFQSYLTALPVAPATLAASDGTYLGEGFHFDLCRAGYALYGGNPSPHKFTDTPMLPVVKLLAKIVQVHDFRKGETIGYGASYTAPKDMRVATISLGYADGYFRSLSGNNTVFVGAHEVPVIGRVSMDLVTLDVTDVPDALLFKGCWVEVINAQRSIDKIAKNAGTIGYEVLTSLGNRFHCVYVENGN